MKLPRQHNRKWFIVPVFLLVGGFVFFVPKSFSSSPTVQTAKYDYRGPHMFSAWAIIRSDFLPVAVMANNTGIIPRYMSLEELNGTVIGLHYEVTSISTVTTTMTYLNGYSHSTTTQTMTTTHGLGLFQNRTQTGWYWDSIHKLLYIHFQTWNNARYHVTEISVDFPLDIMTVTQTITEIVTVTVTSTVTNTVTITSTVTPTVTTIRTVTTTFTTVRTCTVVCLP